MTSAKPTRTDNPSWQPDMNVRVFPETINDPAFEDQFHSVDGALYFAVHGVRQTNHHVPLPNQTIDVYRHRLSDAISTRQQNKWQLDHEDFSIHEKDYLTVKEMLKRFRDRGVPGTLLASIGLRDDDRRVCALTMGSWDYSLSFFAGELECLTELNLCGLNIRALYPSIQKFHNLKILKLDEMPYLMELPDWIGEMVDLEYLSLSTSGVTSIPPSIGRLKNLKYLRLAELPSRIQLPDEIGELIGLIGLDLWGSSITSLPPSVGHLQGLKELNLRGTDELVQLPDEIGDLSHLIKFSLSGSSVRYLPASVGKWKRLQELNLGNALFHLPEAIGNFTCLKAISLQYSEIKALPGSFGKLSNLMHLNLYGSSILEAQKLHGVDEFLLQLCRDHPILGDLGPKDLQWGWRGYDEPKICHALACNRARSRIGSRAKCFGMLPNRLPYLLHCATRAFAAYPSLPWLPVTTRSISKVDAIYHLLANDLMESFLGALINRARTEPFRASKKARIL